ncbi:hypothetical protein KNE206_25880 [Kitasatospora sp. NE20-6]
MCRSLDDLETNGTPPERDFASKYRGFHSLNNNAKIHWEEVCESYMLNPQVLRAPPNVRELVAEGLAIRALNYGIHLGSCPHC